MKIKYGFCSSDEIKLNLWDIFLLLIGKKINGHSAINIKLWRFILW